MPALSEKSITSLQAFTDYIATIRKSSTGPLWYRGCHDRTHKLLPSLFRHPQKTATIDLATLESDLLRRFRQRAVPFGAPRLDNEWEALFIMQHYGVPTRLLDWSENPFIAFFFAVTGARPNSSGKFDHDAAIWVIDPAAWNKTALREINFTDGVLSVGENALSGHSWRQDYDKMRKHPVAILGPHNSARIVAQRGVFTIFGQSTEPMETTYRNDNHFTKDCLLKIRLSKRYIKSLRHAIVELGITDSVVFPDLDGLAKELKRYFAFEA